MTIGRKIISAFILGFLVLLIAGGGYLAYAFLIYPAKQPFNAIPSDALAVIRIKTPEKLLRELETKNRLWQEWSQVEGMSLIRDQIQRLDSLKENLQSPLFPDSGPWIISFHEGNSGALSPLLLVGMSNKSSEQAWARALGKMYPHTVRNTLIPFKKADLTDIPLENGKHLYYTFSNGLLILSDCDTLARHCIKTLKDKSSMMEDQDFATLHHYAGTRVDANIFIKPRLIPLLTADVLGERSQPFLDLMDHFSDWFGLDLILKPDEMILNGYASPGGPSKYLQSFSAQEPVEINIAKVLPYNTVSLLWMGLDQSGNYREMVDQFVSGLSPDGAGTELPLLTLPLETASHVEIGYATTWPVHKGGRSNHYVLIRDDRQNKIQTALVRMSDPTYNADYKGLKVKRTLATGDRSFLSVSGLYYSKASEFFVFSETPAAVQYFLDNYINGKTLDISDNYRDFSDNVSAESNIYFYVNLRHAQSRLRQLVDPGHQHFLDDQATQVRNLQGAAVQLSRMNDLVFANIYLKHNEAYQEEDLSLWKCQLDQDLIQKPYLIYDHREGKLKIIVFDRKNHMYLVDHLGNIIWKIKLNEPPISNVYQVDYYKNGKIQYLFNTQNYLYLIDLLGRDVGNYPIRLNKKATGGISVFDYSDHKDYRLLIPSEDFRVYNYELKGIPVDGWVNPKLSHPIHQPPQHLVAGNRDYVLITDEEGKIMITDRRGKVRIKLREDVTKARHSEFHINRTNSKGIIITTDTRGHLVYIAANGEISETVFDDFSPNHYFLYSDFDKNGFRDFIFVDRNKLVVYDRFKNVIFGHQFNDPVTAPPQIFESSSGEKLLGVVLGNASQLYLFNQNGEIIISSGIIGETPFTVGSLNQDKILNLLVGADNILYNYTLE